jgi:hypothetical protein
MNTNIYLPSSLMSIIDKTISTEEIRKEMMNGNEMKIKYAKEWLKYPFEVVRLLLHETGTYVIPTEELIDYLDKLIGNKPTIEICAGNGFIGRELNITMTDSYQQVDDADTVAYYKAMGQPTIKYPHDVLKYEALKAVQKFKPHTVLGCYATHKWRYDTMDGNYAGVDFGKLYSKVHRLILVGNLITHKNNPLMKYEHQEIELDGLLTRAADSETNRIFIWEH